MLVIAVLGLLLLLFIWWRWRRSTATARLVCNYVERENDAIERGQNQLRERLYRTILRQMIEAGHARPNEMYFIVNRAPRITHAPPVVQPDPAPVPMPVPDLQMQQAILQSITAMRNATPAGARVERGKRYLEATRKVTSDRQNVHDSAVNMHLRDTYTALAVGAAPAASSDQWRNLQTTLLAAPALNAEGRKTLNYILNENPVVYSLAVGGAPPCLKDVLWRVYSRADHADNAGNRDELRRALAESLNDCYENGTQVCSGGITARLLSSLAMLDHDPEIGRVQTLEQHKHDLMTQAAAVLEQLNKEWAASEDAAKRQYADPAYTGEHPDGLQDEFKRLFEARVDELVAAVESRFRPIGIKEMIMGAI